MVRKITTHTDRLEGSSYDPNALPMNEAEGIPWSDETTDDLKRALEHGDSVAEAAMFLQYSEETVRAKMKELGLSTPRRGKARAKGFTKERLSLKTEAEVLAPPDLMKIAAPVRQKPQATRQLIEATIVKLCRGRFLTLRHLAYLLDRNAQTLRNDYIKGMISDGRLRLRFPERQKSPQQAYGAEHRSK